MGTISDLQPLTIRGSPEYRASSSLWCGGAMPEVWIVASCGSRQSLAWAVHHFIFAACFACCLLPEAAHAQSPCAGIRSTRDFALCVDDVASFQCRNSLSFAALRACFSRTARAMVGDRESEIEKWAGESLAYDCAQWFLPGLIACSTHALSGAPEEWCFRKDENTVSWCSGDPPNPNCKTISCPLTSCNTSSVFSRCGMVFNPKLK
jgi:hypothetical protein